MSAIELRLCANRRTPYGEVVGKISLDLFFEEFGVSISRWNPETYAIQWRNALDSLLQGEVGRVGLVASLEYSLVYLYVFYRSEDRVVVQNMFKGIDPDLPSDAVADHIPEILPPRATHNEEGWPLSEWFLDADGLSAHVSIV